MKMDTPITATNYPAWLIEIGTEELPSSYMPLLERKLQERFQEWLREESWIKASETCHVRLTPRRIVFTIETIEEAQQKKEEWLKGPPVKAAFTQDNQETPALKGFLNRCRSGTYEIRTVENGQYVFGLSRPGNQTVIDFFHQQFPGFLLSFPYEKLMRWGQYQFIRPIKWVLALYGSTLIPMTILDTDSKLATRLLQGQGERVVNSSEEYYHLMHQNGIVLSISEREALIEAQIREKIKNRNLFSARFYIVTENACRTEVPVVVEALFPLSFTALPKEIIETVLTAQMKCFPLYEAETKQLTNRFLFVMNGERNTELVKKGFEKVVTARLSDAAYFYQQDKKIPFSTRKDWLSKVMFMEKLGTMDQKVQRVAYMAEKLGSYEEIQRYSENGLLPQVIQLYKLDLTTLLVQELTELQGTVGKIYIQESDEFDLINDVKDRDEIARAVEESYRPKSDEDTIEDLSRLGVMINLLDRWDTWIGVHCIGLNLSSSGDPLGIRRTVNGLLSILGKRPGTIPLSEYLRVGLEAYQQINEISFDIDKVKSDWNAYYLQRMRSLLSGSVHFGKHRYDIVQAVLNNTGSLQIQSPYEMSVKVDLLEKEILNPELKEQLKELYQSFIRMQKITNVTFSPGLPKDSLFESNAEEALWMAGKTVENEWNHCGINSVLALLYKLNKPIQRFFDEVMVMVDSPSIRENRLRLLSWLLSMMSDFADFSKIVFEGGNEQ
ncbi:glycine--tRNA ligase subunit beta [bacterium]|nr:glycine--tRNA ligase subunit beta [bacterium]